MRQTRDMKMEELVDLPVTISLQDAARALGIGINEAYRQAAAGEFPCPVKKRGGAYRIARADLFRELGLDPTWPGPRRDTAE